MPKLILGFVGQMASGKGTAVSYLKEKYGASTYRFSGMLTDVLNRLYLPNDREHLQKLSQSLRETFGEETLAKVMAEDVKNDTNNVIAIDGIRRPGDVAHLKNVPGFILVHISADIEKRFERLSKRGEKTDDLSKTFEQFKQEHNNEAEIKIEEVAKDAIGYINNNGGISELYKQLDKLVDKFT
ncbi:MAG: AAA family ATPase [Candidatus Magasanikbacteria bacterium]